LLTCKYKNEVDLKQEKAVNLNKRFSHMENAILITVSSLLLISYVSDIASSRTKIPSVIILLLLGWIVRQISLLLNLKIPNLEPILPALGTVGLILIVLEGALEIELEESKLKLILKSILSAFLLSALLLLILTLFFSLVYKVEFSKAFINSVPFAIISSSIAIPSASNFPAILREFVVYETSTSDILGIIYFNFAQSITVNGFGVEKFFLMLFYLLLMVIYINFCNAWTFVFVHEVEIQCQIYTDYFADNFNLCGLKTFPFAFVNFYTFIWSFRCKFQKG